MNQQSPAGYFEYNGATACGFDARNVSAQVILDNF